MKTFQYYIFNIILCGLFLASCSDDHSSPALSDIAPSTLNPLAFQEIVLTQPGDNASPLLCTISWTETRFFFNSSVTPEPAGPVSYTLEIDRLANNFENAAMLAVTTSLYADILVTEMNDILIGGLGAKTGQSIDLEIRLVANYGEGLPKEVIGNNTLALTLTPYAEKKPLQAIYIIGDMNGWDNSNTDFRMFRDNSKANEYVYTYTGRLAANTSFKFVPQESLGTDRMYVDAGNGSLGYDDSSDGSFFNETERYVTITLDVEDMTYIIEEYDISNAKTWTTINLTGAFCDWGETNEPDLVATGYDPHIWTLTINLETVEYGVKFRANHAWDDKWCPKDPDAYPYGLCDFSPEGHDNNIGLPAAGTYDILFNDLTGHYIFTAR